MEYLFIAIISRSLRPGVVAPEKVPSMVQMELFDI